MYNIRRLSRILITVLYGGLIILPCLTTFTWLFNDLPFIQSLCKQGMIRETIHTQEGPINLCDVKLTPLGKALGVLSNIVGSLSSWLSLMVLIKLFKRYKTGQVFSFSNVNAYRQLGGLCLINALAMRPLQELLSSLAVTLSNPPGQRYISIGFGSPNIYDIVTGLIIVTIAWVMAEGYRLQNDQQLTV